MADIYGIDTNDFAESISRAALSNQGAAPKAGSPSSKGVAPQDPGEVSVIKGISKDGRADSCGNHGCNE